MKYRAFISYRHLDNREAGRKWADWLHHQLESYEIPADLVGTPSLHGDQIPESIFPVFQDEKELPADARLGSQIAAALDTSRVLIVLCSPNATTSRYVNEEIAHFKAIGRKDRILALIVDGEPNVTDDPVKRERFGVEKECFPPALRYSTHLTDDSGIPRPDGGTLDTHLAPDGQIHTYEPIAADTRLPDGSQGFTISSAYRSFLESAGIRDNRSAVIAYGERLRLARLKIIAGVLGVSLGQLTRRDESYRLAKARKRVRILTTASVLFLALAAAAGIAGLYALHQRNIAADERDRAIQVRDEGETLVSFMIFELKRGLSETGKTALLDRLQSRVDDYYQELGVDADNPTQSRQRAASLDNQAELALRQGDAATAMQLAEASLAIRKQLAQSPAATVLNEREYGASLIRLGQIAKSQWNPSDARTAYQDAIDWFEKLATRYPDDPAIQFQRSAAIANLADLEETQGNLGEAERLAESARRTLEEIAKSQPGSEEILSTRAHLWNVTGSLRETRGKVAEAAVAFEKARSIYAPMVATRPGNVTYQQGLWKSLTQLAEVERIQGDLAASDELARQGFEIAHKLVLRDPENPLMRQNVAASFSQLGEAQQALGSADLAQQHFENSLDIYRKLSEKHGANLSWRIAQIIPLGHLGGLEMNSGDWSAAADYFRQSLAISRKLLADRPDDLPLTSDVVSALAPLALCAEAQGETETAFVYLTEARQLAHDFVAANPDDLPTQMLFANILGKLSDHHLAEKKPERAVPLAKQSLEINERILEAQPEHPAFSVGYFLALSKLGMAHRMNGDRALAASLARRSLNLLRQSDKFPHLRAPKRDELLVSSLLDLGGIQLEERDLRASRDTYLEAIAIARKLQEASPNDPRPTGVIVDAQLGLVTVDYVAGDTASAIQQMEHARHLNSELIELMPQDHDRKMTHERILQMLNFMRPEQ